MARDVRDQDAHAHFVDQNEVVEIPCHRGHRNIARRNIQAIDSRDLARKNRQLYLPRSLHFTLHHTQLTCQLFAYAAQCQMCPHPRLHHRGREGLMNIIHRSHLKPPRLIVNFSLTRQKNYRDILGLRILFQARTNLVAVHPRHHYIQQNQVRCGILIRQLQSLCPIRRNANLIGVLQDRVHYLNVCGLIVHKKYDLLFCRHAFVSLRFNPSSPAISSSFSSAPENSNSLMSAPSASMRSFATCPFTISCNERNTSSDSPSLDSSRLCKRPARCAAATKSKLLATSFAGTGVATCVKAYAIAFTCGARIASNSFSVAGIAASFSRIAFSSFSAAV